MGTGGVSRLLDGGNAESLWDWANQDHRGVAKPWLTVAGGGGALSQAPSSAADAPPQFPPSDDDEPTQQQGAAAAASGVPGQASAVPAAGEVYPAGGDLGFGLDGSTQPWLLEDSYPLPSPPKAPQQLQQQEVALGAAAVRSLGFFA